MDANTKAARERAIADAIGQRLRDIYDMSEPMPDRLVTLLNQLSKYNTVVTAKAVLPTAMIGTPARPTGSLDKMLHQLHERMASPQADP